jgi:hypothetical protein
MIILIGLVSATVTQSWSRDDDIIGYPPRGETFVHLDLPFPVPV